MQFVVKELSFGEILPIWRDHLWPGRISEIKAVSPIGHDLKFHPELAHTVPRFWGLYSDSAEVAGVISGYKTSDTHYRSRGLFVFPQFRKLGISSKLLYLVCERARTENCKTVWTLPRKEAWPAYKNFGFIQKSEWFEEQMEFGPNCLAELLIIATLSNGLTKPQHNT